ncbi:hypothetical protein NMY22_g12444 [Coprinellus aureogranulatus]|nr:hypothetical protein NMY22_g12444 [Coprinellus aureogranulatus]
MRRYPPAISRASVPRPLSSRPCPCPGLEPYHTTHTGLHHIAYLRSRPQASLFTQAFGKELRAPEHPCPFSGGLARSGEDGKAETRSWLSQGALILSCPQKPAPLEAVYQVYTQAQIIFLTLFFSDRSRDLPHALPGTQPTGSAFANIWSILVPDSEGPAVKFENSIDSQGCPPPFKWTNQMVRATAVPGPDTEALEGCHCIGPCADDSCSCIRKNQYTRPPYNHDGLLTMLSAGMDIHECNSSCTCSHDVCANRVTQGGRNVDVVVKKTAEKGFGVFAGSPGVSKGAFLGAYSGVMLNWNDAAEVTTESQDPERDRYMFAIDFEYLRDTEKWRPACVVDAYERGNLTRFVNHSCEPNAIVVGCHVDDALHLTPKIAFFASRDIDEGEEITICYSGTGLGRTSVGPVTNNICRCNSPSCTGQIY